MIQVFQPQKIDQRHKAILWAGKNAGWLVLGITILFREEIRRLLHV